MPRNDRDHGNLVVATAPCCGRYPVTERLGERRYQVVCAFCKRRGPVMVSQNRARDAWNETTATATPEVRSDVDQELRDLMAERVSRYQRGELSWQQPGPRDPARHPLTTGPLGRRRVRKVA